MRLHEVFQGTLERMIGSKSERLRATLRSMRVKSKRSNPSNDLVGSEEQMSDYDQGQMPGAGDLNGGRE